MHILTIKGVCLITPDSMAIVIYPRFAQCHEVCDPPPQFMLSFTAVPKFYHTFIHVTELN